MGFRSLFCGVAAAGLALSLAACDTSSSSGSGGGTGGGNGGTGKPATTSMTVDMGYGGTTIARVFNPYSPNAVIGTDGYTYETLFGYDYVDNSTFVPWLATGIAWADGGKTLTIHLDPRANWSDGQPLTADDVVFTFQYVQQAGLGAVTYQSITATDPHTVVLKFAQPGYTNIGTIGSYYFIIPKHIFQGQNLKTWTNPNPVASGPYTLKSYAPQELVWQARAHYWKGDVPVKTLYAPVMSQATGVLPLLLNGQVGWSGGAVPNVMNDYVAKDPTHNHAWYPSYGADLYYPNMSKAPFSNVHVRRGLSLAMDRGQLDAVVNRGLEYPINLTGMDQKTQGGWIDQSLASDVQAGAEDSQALAEFAQAGYHQQGGKLVNASGQQLTLSISEDSSFGDSIKQDHLLCQQYAAVGINCTVQALPTNTLLINTYKGDFDLVGGGVVYGVTPYDFYSATLYGKYVGNQTFKNKERYNNPQVNSLLDQMTQTGDQTALHQLAAQIEKIVVSDVPFIANSDVGASTEYSTSQWTGWPTPDNPYALPAPWAGPPDEINVLLHLKPAS